MYCSVKLGWTVTSCGDGGGSANVHVWPQCLARRPVHLYYIILSCIIIYFINLYYIILLYPQLDLPGDCRQETRRAGPLCREGRQLQGRGRLFVRLWAGLKSAPS